MIVHRLCIVGLGMMGGAIGLAARRAGSATRVIGVADNLDTVQKARAKGTVDDATLDLRAGVQDADLVILCVPVKTILDAAAAVIPACREGTIITDIGSSKAVIVQQVDAMIHRLKSKCYFVGSHPITGSEKKGIEAADQVILAGASCAITPTPHTDNEAYHKVEEFWKSLDLKTVRLSPEDHDAFLARSSHLPHLLSAALIGVQSDRSLQISGPGLRDMTRLAAADPAMWVDIAEQNATELSRALKDLSQEVARLSQDVEMLAAQGTPGAESARERIFRYLADARQRHDKRFAPPEVAPEPEVAEAEDGESPGPGLGISV
ncbi:MAG TPA: prephenate dehydrogenase [Planctomycetota bacterium]